MNAGTLASAGPGGKRRDVDLQTNTQQFAGVQQTGGMIQNGTVTLNAGNYDLQGGTVVSAAGGDGGDITGDDHLPAAASNTYAARRR